MKIKPILALSGATTRICGVRFGPAALFRYGKVETDAKAFCVKKSGEVTEIALLAARSMRMGTASITFTPAAKSQPAPDAWVELAGNKGRCRVWAPVPAVPIHTFFELKKAAE